MRKGCDRDLKIAILLQFLTIEPHFVRKGCDRDLKIAILLQFLTIEPHFVRKGCRGHLKSQFYRSFCGSNLISCERVATDTLKSNLPQFLTIEPHFVRKGCISWRLVGIAPRLKREIENQEREEGKRATGQESKRARERRCEDEKM